MKCNIPAFFSGALTTALVGTIAVSALAASGRMTIEVDPVNVQVNGQVFVPTDANGKEVPVFAYNGTTYAPLRALAEAYGLEVGYDANANMAMVIDADKSSFLIGEDEIKYVNSLGEVEDKYDYEFDPVHIFVNDEKISGNAHDSVVINQKTFLNISKVAKVCGIEIQISDEVLSDGYVTIQGDYYVPLLRLLKVIPTKDFDLDEDNILHLSV